MQNIKILHTLEYIILLISMIGIMSGRRVQGGMMLGYGGNRG